MTNNPSVRFIDDGEDCLARSNCAKDKYLHVFNPDDCLVNYMIRQSTHYVLMLLARRVGVNQFGPTQFDGVAFVSTNFDLIEWQANTRTRGRLTLCD